MPSPKNLSPAKTEFPGHRQGLRHSDSLRQRFRRGDQGGDGVGRFITSLAILHNDWSSGPRDSSFAFHWSFLLSLIRLICRRLTSALRAASWVIYHYFRSAFFRTISSWIPDGIGSRGSSRGRRLGLVAARVFRTAPDKFSTYVSIAISLCNFELKGIRSFKWVWYLAQSVCLKSWRSGGLWKDEGQAVSMRTARWSEFSAEHEVRYNGNESFLVITMSKISE